MFSLKIRYTLYGIILSTSLITLVAQATTTDGVFGEYFQKMTGVCSALDAEVITGFNDTPTSSFGQKICTSLTSLLAILDIHVTPTGDVGLGVSSPTVKLDVAGKVESSSVNFTDSVNTLTTRDYVDAGLQDLCEKMGGTWSFMSTCTMNPIYTWQMGSYGACSPSCGPGTQYATVNCKSNTGAVVSDSLCAGTKPAASQPCNNGACMPTSGPYTYGAWGACTNTCGPGNNYQTRTQSCGYDSCHSPQSTSQSCGDIACAISCTVWNPPSQITVPSQVIKGTSSFNGTANIPTYSYFTNSSPITYGGDSVPYNLVTFYNSVPPTVIYQYETPIFGGDTSVNGTVVRYICPY